MRTADSACPVVTARDAGCPASTVDALAPTVDDAGHTSTPICMRRLEALLVTVIVVVIVDPVVLVARHTYTAAFDDVPLSADATSVHVSDDVSLIPVKSSNPVSRDAQTMMSSFGATTTPDWESDDAATFARLYEATTRSAAPRNDCLTCAGSADADAPAVIPFVGISVPPSSDGGRGVVGVTSGTGSCCHCRRQDRNPGLVLVGETPPVRRVTGPKPGTSYSSQRTEQLNVPVVDPDAFAFAITNPADVDAAKTSGSTWNDHTHAPPAVTASAPTASQFVVENVGAVDHVESNVNRDVGSAGSYGCPARVAVLVPTAVDRDRYSAGAVVGATAIPTTISTTRGRTVVAVGRIWKYAELAVLIPARLAPAPYRDTRPSPARSRLRSRRP
jgi:hypothetical protein